MQPQLPDGWLPILDLRNFGILLGPSTPIMWNGFAQSDKLLASSLAYLLLPYVLFLVYWIKWPIAISALVLLVMAYVFAVRIELIPATLSSWRPYIGWLGRVALVLALIVGIGEVTWQTSDYLKHNLIWVDLVAKAWPVRYQDPVLGSVFLDYYLAYYLPAGWLGKWLGLSAVPIITYLWASLGLWLGMRWLLRISPGGWPYLLVSMFLVGSSSLLWRIPTSYSMAASTMDWIWLCILPHTPTFFTGEIGFHLLDTVTTLHWAPQHGIVAILGVGMLTYAIKHQIWAYTLLAVAAIMFWSIFIAAGLGFIVMVSWLGQPKRSIASLPNLLGMVAILGILIPYFACHVPNDYQRWVFGEFGLPYKYGMLAVFFILNLGSFVAIMLYAQVKWHIRSRLFMLGYIGCVLVIGSCWYQIGIFHDTFLRFAFLGSLFIHLGFGEACSQLMKRLRRPWRWALLAWIGFCMVSPVGLLWTNATDTYNRQKNAIVPPLNSSFYPGVQQLNRLHPQYEVDLQSQYLGYGDSWFGKYLLRENKEMPQSLDTKNPATNR